MRFLGRGFRRSLFLVNFVSRPKEETLTAKPCLEIVYGPPKGVLYHEKMELMNATVPVFLDRKWGNMDLVKLIAPNKLVFNCSMSIS